jgi:hypothetical protein
MRISPFPSLALVLLLACGRAQETGAPLFHGLNSGMGPEAVQAQLAIPGEQWQLVDDYNPPRGRSQNIRLQRVELRHFQHLGVDGRLVLYFFNDSLFRARFHPSDFLRLQRLLVEREGLTLAPGKSVEIEPTTRVRALRDQDGGGYLLYEDLEILALWEAITKRR